jgi:iron complex transport system ATP-binding protein
VSLFGRDLAAMPRAEAGRTVSLVPQDEHIPFEYTLLDYVLLGRTPHLNALAVPGEADRQLGLASLERVGLAEHAHAPITETSGGEKHLVMIARSLCQNTPLLVLDEPAAHLDLANKRRLVNLITELRDENDGSVIFTTHDPDLAAVAADEIILLLDGQTHIQGVPETVLTGEHLSATFGVPLEVHWRGRHPHIVW